MMFNIPGALFIWMIFYNANDRNLDFCVNIKLTFLSETISSGRAYFPLGP